MRQWIYAATASLALLGAAPEANAFPVDRLTTASVASEIEPVQFVFGGRRYCWYDSGWQGPGFYWCGYSWRRGLGWGWWRRLARLEPSARPCDRASRRPVPAMVVIPATSAVRAAARPGISAVQAVAHPGTSVAVRAAAVRVAAVDTAAVAMVAVIATETWSHP